MSQLHTPLLSPTDTATVPPACQATRLQLDAFVDGEVDEDKRTAVLEHLTDCTHCQCAERSLRALLAAMERTRLPVVASRRLRLRIALLFAEQQRTNG